MLPIPEKSDGEFAGAGDPVKYEYLKAALDGNFQADFETFDQLTGFRAYMDEDPILRLSAHYYRYVNTFRLMCKYLGPISQSLIVETGGACPISYFLKRENQVFKTDSDLRESMDVEDGSADIIFSFEVLEHLKDIPERSFGEIVLFQESGARRFAAEAFRALKPGGYLVLTTPNPVSYYAISEAIAGRAPQIFRPHVREYTHDELISIFSEFKVIHHETMFNFFMIPDMGSKWFNTFEGSGWSTSNRGDDHFLLLRKLPFDS